MIRVLRFVALVGSLFSGVIWTTRASTQTAINVMHLPAPGSEDFRPVFFPPATPIFGRPIRTGSTGRFFGVVVAPPALADDVNELFYAPLGTRSSKNKLGEKLAQQLAAYHATRAALLNELQNQLTALVSAEPPAREHELRAFAARQTPRLVALEAEAEQLREKLIRGGGFPPYNGDWNRDRDWTLGHLPPGTPPALAPAAEYHVLQAAAYYQSGLSVEQRGWLREIAMERQEDHLRRTRGGWGKLETDVFFFSPETARFQSPPGLTRELEAKIITFDQIKGALKKELCDLLIAEDDASASHRTKALEKLAETQWPRVAGLETLAEEIRRGLAALPSSPTPSLPAGIPLALIARIDAYKQENNALQREALQQIRGDTALLLTPPDLQSSPRSVAQLFREMAAARIEQMKLAEARFRAENAGRYEALAEKLRAITADLTAVAASEIDPATGKPIDVSVLVRRINASDQEFEKVAREETLYKNYRIAMFEPGLSPEQRRLLFGAALVELAQPLPPGGRMPMENSPLEGF
jgi:hypothetical protein